MPTDFDNMNYAGFPAGGNKKEKKLSRLLQILQTSLLL